jgi:hypothetical protein
MKPLEDCMSDEDWFNLGKADAWARRPKQPPSQNSLAASMYDLGYSEGSIERSPINNNSTSKARQ